MNNNQSSITNTIRDRLKISSGIFALSMYFLHSSLALFVRDESLLKALVLPAPFALAAGFAYFYIMKSFSKGMIFKIEKSIEGIKKEGVIFETYAEGGKNILESYGGKLSLTNTSVHFTPHPFNSKEILPVNLLLDDIKSITLKQNFFNRNKIFIELNNTSIFTFRSCEGITFLNEFRDATS